MIKAGIIGGSGYTAGELLRILVFHPNVEIDFVYSTTKDNEAVSNIHADLLGNTDISFTNKINPDVDVLFLCLGHGTSKSFLSENMFSNETKIIDLSNDFRLKADEIFQNKKFVYGLPELNKNEIINANYIANPGCFATAIQLGLLPLASKNLLQSDVHINATTGSTGAGVKPGGTTHFSWRDNNFSSYKVFNHQHLGEINESLEQLQDDFNAELVFIPNRGNFSKGIYASMYTESDLELEEIQQLYKDYYRDHPFVFISEKAISLKQVVNTNKCILHIEKHGKRIFITSIIDNLVKGASGQAIQNMNLIFGLEETTGLLLKASAF
ncbi:N-acetyl-gamma-glutamyl-phosphate reductase [Spongiivirga citrea]|uniref:N-acetyl-gamma-glutamyl-phosphate reductase n=1 Tax=Spongiivirga citrea TaxID=1481457 RepID=A0A6M0CR20_9FLAO|nr:N-acetyl-gamma-glutamyl-phosphate reductase [Spongiivirga citrea]NER16390.1 N-acetyl-gamma-glutamyl-phosphate reductase [Spongiivirga citrea]